MSADGGFAPKKRRVSGKLTRESWVRSKSWRRCVRVKKKIAQVRAGAVDGGGVRWMRAKRLSAIASEKILAWKRCGRDCRAIPFLNGTQFRDGSVYACADLRKPSPCNNSFSKNFGHEIAVRGTRLFSSGVGRFFLRCGVRNESVLRHGLKFGWAELGRWRPRRHRA